jgi:hypothetical protein
MSIRKSWLQLIVKVELIAYNFVTPVATGLRPVSAFPMRIRIQGEQIIADRDSYMDPKTLHYFKHLFNIFLSQDPA